jgi:hypothetical protein
MSTLEVIETPHEMMKAIATKPDDLFYGLLVTLESIRDPHPENILSVLVHHGLRVAPDVAQQLDGARYQESDPGLELCVARPPWETSEKPAYPEAPVAVSVLFCELARSAKSQQFEAVIQVSPDNVIRRASYVWAPQKDDGNRMSAQLLAQHIALLNARSHKSVTTEYGQLNQL